MPAIRSPPSCWRQSQGADPAVGGPDQSIDWKVRSGGVMIAFSERLRRLKVKMRWSSGPTASIRSRRVFGISRADRRHQARVDPVRDKRPEQDASGRVVTQPGIDELSAAPILRDADHADAGIGREPVAHGVQHAPSSASNPCLMAAPASAKSGAVRIAARRSGTGAVSGLVPIGPMPAPPPGHRRIIVNKK